MKTYNIICIKIVLFVSTVVIFSSCKKNEDSEFLLQNEWKAKSISIDEKTMKAPSKTFREYPYILKFINDSCFALTTSVNFTEWKYQIVSDGNIVIGDYFTTRACCENNFDEQMINVMNNVTNYYCKGNRLIFSADKNEKIIFEKQ